MEQRRLELKRTLDSLREELNRLQATDKLDEAAKTEQRIDRLERELARLEKRPRLRGQRRLEGGLREAALPREQSGLPPQGMDELHLRLHHLQAAIDNLHAAGMHEAAERLAREKERMVRTTNAGLPTVPQARGEAARELERLRLELRELRSAIGELRRRVEELDRQRR